MKLQIKIQIINNLGKWNQVFIESEFKFCSKKERTTINFTYNLNFQCLITFAGPSKRQEEDSFMIEESDNMLFANQQRLDDYDNDQPSVIHSFYEYPTLMLKNPDDSVISLNDTIHMITLTNQDKPPSFQEVSVFT